MNISNPIDLLTQDTNISNHIDGVLQNNEIIEYLHSYGADIEETKNVLIRATISYLAQKINWNVLVEQAKEKRIKY